MHFADRIQTGIERAGAPACVGLDPVAERLPQEIRVAHHDPLAAVGEFGREVLHAVAGTVSAVKFQSACYERYGSRGVAVLEQHIGLASGLGLTVVLDAKRGDIGLSAAHYAAAAVRMGAHAMTVNGYLGPSGIEPFLDAGLGVFVLVRTSNPDSDPLQAARLGDGRSVACAVAQQVAALGRSRMGLCGLSDVGAVVGATKAVEGRELRDAMPDQIFLVPGYGAQGGTAEDIRSLLRPDRRGVLVTASRSVIYPEATGSWRRAVADAAKRFRDEIASVVQEG
jgi:orotidine-5'-phosphate decarboxylase